MRTESHLRLTPKETDILGLKRKLDLAKGIIEKEGRPSIVRAVCQISKASTLQFHKEIHGHGPTIRPGLDSQVSTELPPRIYLLQYFSKNFL